MAWGVTWPWGFFNCSSSDTVVRGLSTIVHTFHFVHCLSLEWPLHRNSSLFTCFLISTFFFHENLFTHPFRNSSLIILTHEINKDFKNFGNLVILTCSISSLLYFFFYFFNFFFSSLLYDPWDICVNCFTDGLKSYYEFIVLVDSSLKTGSYSSFPFFFLDLSQLCFILSTYGCDRY